LARHRALLHVTHSSCRAGELQTSPCASCSTVCRPSVRESERSNSRHGRVVAAGSSTSSARRQGAAAALL
jgi:hypothetical protein